MAFLGVDIGTGGCKATVCDEHGRLYGSAYEEYDIIRHQGRHELDSRKVWDSICRVIQQAVENSPGKRVEAICASSLGEAAVPVDERREILGNAMVYTDCRGQDEVQSICSAVGKMRVGKITGVNPNRIFTINKVLWIKKHEPALYEKTYKFLQFEDFLTFMLTGQAYISYSLASRTMAFDVVHKCWSREILSAAGVPSSKFSTPCASGTVVGEVLPEMARMLGLPGGVKVVVGAQDQICAAVGAGILENGMAVDGMGSTHCITPVFDRPLISEFTINAGYACCPHAVDGMYATYAYTFSGGNLIRWFRDTLAGRERETCGKSGANLYQYLDRQAETVRSELLVLPHFTGGGPPYMDDDSRGMLYGLSLNTTLPQIYRAFLEGISFEMRHNLEALARMGVEIHTLRACGGGANSKIWLQMQSDIFGLPIEQLRTKEAGTVGCAIICGTALGAFKDLREGVSAYLDIGEKYLPNPASTAYYQEKYARFLRLYKAGRQIRSAKAH
jgi:xylulokinase